MVGCLSGYRRSGRSTLSHHPAMKISLAANVKAYTMALKYSSASIKALTVEASLMGAKEECT